MIKSRKDKKVEKKINEFVEFKNFNQPELVKDILLNYYYNNNHKAFLLSKQLKDYDFIKDIIDEYVFYTSKTNENNERVEDYEYTCR